MCLRASSILHSGQQLFECLLCRDFRCAKIGSHLKISLICEFSTGAETGLVRDCFCLCSQSWQMHVYRLFIEPRVVTFFGRTSFFLSLKKTVVGVMVGNTTV